MKRFLVFPVFAGLVLAGMPAQAATVWSSGSDILAGGDFLSVSMIADQFFLTSPTTLTGVRFWQGEFAVAPNPPDLFYWTVYSDASGSPGSVLYSGFTTNYTRVLSGTTTLNGFQYNSYQTDFAIDPGLLAAGAYWLGLGDANGGGAYWDTSVLGCGSSCPDGTAPGVITPGPGQYTHNVEYAFELSDAPAPEPATSGLVLSAGLAGLLMYRRRA